MIVAASRTSDERPRLQLRHRGIGCVAGFRETLVRMNHRGHNAVAGAFENREIAHSCDDALNREGFVHRWMALTKRAESNERDVVTQAEALPALAGSDDRFVSGEGSSLRSSLEEHGIEKTEALAIEESLAVGGAVIVVAAHDRIAVAASIIRRSGGLVYGFACEAETSP
jgi:hypothetical protein